MLSVIFLLFTKVYAVETYICGWNSDRTYECKLISEKTETSFTSEDNTKEDDDEDPKPFTFKPFSFED